MASSWSSRQRGVRAKATAVLKRMTEAYESEYANVHRGLHYLANAAPKPMRAARQGRKVPQCEAQ